MSLWETGKSAYYGHSLTNPLHVATQEGDDELVQELLIKGVKVNQTDAVDFTSIALGSQGRARGDRSSVVRRTSTGGLQELGRPKCAHHCGRTRTCRYSVLIVDQRSRRELIR